MRNGKDFLLSRINDSLTVMATRSCTQRGLQLGVQTPAGSIQPCLIVSKNRSIRFCHGSRNVVSNRHTICWFKCLPCDSQSSHARAHVSVAGIESKIISFWVNKTRSAYRLFLFLFAFLTCNYKHWTVAPEKTNEPMPTNRSHINTRQTIGMRMSRSILIESHFWTNECQRSSISFISHLLPILWFEFFCFFVCNKFTDHLNYMHVLSRGAVALKCVAMATSLQQRYGICVSFPFRSTTWFQILILVFQLHNLSGRSFTSFLKWMRVIGC